jgi:RNA recognition motif-containing protein
LFGQYGPITSLVIGSNDLGRYAFICYGSPTDNEAGPKAAIRAVEELNDKVIDEKPLYVREALKKSDREVEKKRDKIRYKNSKKRCNLFVKNFPPNTTKEQLEELFSKYGEIENIKINTNETQPSYAFVCFKSPEKAMLAKNELHNYVLNGKQLYINHYEIKEIRKTQQDELRDQIDFNNYKKQHNPTNPTDMLNNPQIH